MLDKFDIIAWTVESPLYRNTGHAPFGNYLGLDHIRKMPGAAPMIGPVLWIPGNTDTGFTGNDLRAGQQRRVDRGRRFLAQGGGLPTDLADLFDADLSGRISRPPSRLVRCS